MLKEDLKKLLLSFNEYDYFKNVDLHIHSCESDGKMSPVEILEQAKIQNKKYIAIADHNTIEAYCSTNILSDDTVISAVEFDCYYKYNIIHILGYGIDIDNPEIKSLMAKSKLGTKFNFYRAMHLRNPKTVIEKIKEAGGIPVLAHPACYPCTDIEYFVKQLVDYGLEGIEVYYYYRFLRKLLSFHSKEKIIDIANKYNLIKTGGTDSHGRKLL